MNQSPREMSSTFKGEWVWINRTYRRGQRMKKPRKARRMGRRNTGYFRMTYSL